MSMNYYLEHDGDMLHIGMSSKGWAFQLHVIPEMGLWDLPQWLPLLMAFRILDEQDRPVPLLTLLQVILGREGVASDRPPLGYTSWADFYQINRAEPGPFNLHRCKIGVSCMAHGAGTYDLVLGEFS